MKDINTLIALGSFVGGALSTAWGMLQMYGQSRQKEFAAQMEFRAVEGHLAEIKESLSEVSRKQQLADDRLLKVEVILSERTGTKMRPLQ